MDQVAQIQQLRASRKRLVSERDDLIKRTAHLEQLHRAHVNLLSAHGKLVREHAIVRERLRGIERIGGMLIQFVTNKDRVR